jgi:hypothetical protein
MRNENESLQSLQSESDELRAQVNSLSIERIIKVSSADVNEILAIDDNPRSLATSVAQLKCDLAESIKDKNKLQNSMNVTADRLLAVLRYIVCSFRGLKCYFFIFFRDTEISDRSEKPCRINFFFISNLNVFFPII